MEPLSTLAISALLAWASGMRLYLVVFVLGLLARFGFFAPPGDLAWLTNSWVLGAAGFMTLVEFFADKVPALDSLWDAIHTFIRIPAGAALAAAAVGFDQHTAAVVMGLLGGTITSGTHLTKSGTRALINTSPEPISNWTASFSEDGAVMGGIGLALFSPAVFLALLAGLLVLMLWWLPKVWRGVRRVLGRLSSS